jgi:hypothetical protein
MGRGGRGAGRLLLGLGALLGIRGAVGLREREMPEIIKLGENHIHAAHAQSFLGDSVSQSNR